MSNFDIDDLRTAIKDVERIHGSERAAKIIRAGAPDYNGDLTHIPENVYPGLILDLQEAVAGRRTFGQPRHSTFHTVSGGVRDGLPGNSGDAPTLDTTAIWERRNGKKGKAGKHVAPRRNDAPEDDGEDDKTPSQPNAEDLHAKAYANWNRPHRAPRA